MEDLIIPSGGASDLLFSLHIIWMLVRGNLQPFILLLMGGIILYQKKSSEGIEKKRFVGISLLFAMIMAFMIVMRIPRYLPEAFSSITVLAMTLFVLSLISSSIVLRWGNKGLLVQFSIVLLIMAFEIIGTYVDQEVWLMDLYLYNIASVSGMILIGWLLVRMTPNHHLHWFELFIAVLGGTLSAYIAADFHVRIERITFFSEQFYRHQHEYLFPALDAFRGRLLSSFFYTLYIGLSEEFFKILAFFVFFVSANRIRNLFQSLLYAEFTALGFAGVENLLYANLFGVNISILRNLMNSHAFFGTIVGFLAWRFLQAEKWAHKMALMIAMLLIPALIHAIWNLFAMGVMEGFSKPQLLYSGFYICLVLTRVLFTIQAYREEAAALTRLKKHPWNESVGNHSETPVS